MTANQIIKIAIIFINYGPYHLARARALKQMPGLDPSFIQLAGSIESHPWRVDSEASPIELHTLSQLPYEKCGYAHLARSLHKTLNKISPDVVVTASYRPFIMLKAARWARSRGRHAVLFFETTRWDRFRHSVAEKMKRWMIALYYDAAFVGGRAHREYLLELQMSRSRIWQPYDVVDNERFAQLAARVRANSERWRKRLGLPQHYFLYVGRYSAEKNLVRLLQAYQLYHTRSPAGWSMVLVGDGPQRAELQRFASNAGSCPILVRPFEQIETLVAYYALAECFILPSTVDPWGLVVNEAMACGLPVLVSRLCGCAFDLVTDGGNGFLFDPNDIDALADLLGRMSSLDQAVRQAMSAQSRQVIAAFTPAIWAENLAQCVKTVTREKHDRANLQTALK